jgi:hypothetical protein
LDYYENGTAFISYVFAEEVIGFVKNKRHISIREEQQQQLAAKK